MGSPAIGVMARVPGDQVSWLIVTACTLAQWRLPPKTNLRCSHIGETKGPPGVVSLWRVIVLIACSGCGHLLKGVGVLWIFGCACLRNGPLQAVYARHAQEGVCPVVMGFPAILKGMEMSGSTVPRCGDVYFSAG